MAKMNYRSTHRRRKYSERKYLKNATLRMMGNEVRRMHQCHFITPRNGRTAVKHLAERRNVRTPTLICYKPAVVDHNLTLLALSRRNGSLGVACTPVTSHVWVMVAWKA